MRLFIATPVTIPFYKSLIDAISPFLEANFTKGFSLHLTHHFIGEANPKDYEFNLQVPNEKITIQGFGFFGEKILYMRASSPNIDAIYYQLKQKGFIKDKKPFVAHITIARIKKIKDKAKLVKALQQFEDKSINVPFLVFLYNSTLTPNGPIYKKIYQY